MGFNLVKAVVAPTEHDGGWAKHVFYDTGGDGLMAFWDLHDDAIGDFDPAISTGAGLPAWVNHVAFHAAPDEIEGRKQRWLDAGFDCMEVDHGFCVSIYAVDPNGILVEWCADTRALDETDHRRGAGRAPRSEPTARVGAGADVPSGPEPGGRPLSATGRSTSGPGARP